MEARLPIIVVVRVAYCSGATSNEEEMTHSDNISPSGARIYSQRPCRAGDMIWVAPLHEEPVCANVIYCHSLPDDRYRFGVKFEDGPVEWPILQRYARP